jgi:hypothetical protein
VSLANVLRYASRSGLFAIYALLLAGCIDSSGPILTDPQPALGQRLNLQLYSLRDGHAFDPERSRFTWNGKLYAHASGSLDDVRGFTLHAFEGGDYIVQSIPAGHPEHIEYALMRKLAEGVYQVIAIDEADADEPTRAANCKHPGGVACRIETREQLFAFARATAARRKTDGGLAIRLPDDARPPKRRH